VVVEALVGLYAQELADDLNGKDFAVSQLGGGATPSDALLL
jgi:hypothetical protein